MGIVRNGSNHRSIWSIAQITLVRSEPMHGHRQEGDLALPTAAELEETLRLFFRALASARAAETDGPAVPEACGGASACKEGETRGDPAAGGSSRRPGAHCCAESRRASAAQDSAAGREGARGRTSGQTAIGSQTGQISGQAGQISGQAGQISGQADQNSRRGGARVRTRGGLGGQAGQISGQADQNSRRGGACVRTRGGLGGPAVRGGRDEGGGACSAVGDAAAREGGGGIQGDAVATKGSLTGRPASAGYQAAGRPAGGSGVFMLVRFGAVCGCGCWVVYS
jgi:hypothetical protein